MTAQARSARFAGAAAVLWGGLCLSRGVLEASMTLHMTVQIPLLAASGLLLAHATSRREPRWLAEADWLGIPGILLASLFSAFWMLPRSLDGALATTGMEIAKFLTLPLLVGLPLGLSWRRLPPVGRGFVWANFLSMLGVVGWLYLAAPVRVCVYYLIDQQVIAGWTLIAVAAVLAAACLADVMLVDRLPAPSAGLPVGSPRA